MSYVTMSDLGLGQADAAAAAPPPVVPRGRNMGSWFGAGRPFAYTGDAGAFGTNADKAILDAVAAGDTDKFKFVLADIAKVGTMGPTHATADEVEKWFGNPPVVDLATALWNEVAAGNPPAALTVSFPAFTILNRNVPLGQGTPGWRAGTRVPIPGETYDQMRRAPMGTGGSGSGAGAPKGALESLDLDAQGRVRAVGWAFVPAQPSTPVKVQFTAERKEDGSQTRIVAPVLVPREDVNRQHGIAGNHGFVAVADMPVNGTYVVYAYAVNEATGDNVALQGSPKTVMVAKRSAAPTFTAQQPPPPPPMAFPVPPTTPVPSIPLPPATQVAAPPAAPVASAPVTAAPAATGDEAFVIMGMRLPGKVLGIRTPWFLAGAAGLALIGLATGGRGDDEDEEDEES